MQRGRTLAVNRRGEHAGWIRIEAHTPGPAPRLLGFGGERRGEEAACDHAKEDSPVHYSIT